MAEYIEREAFYKFLTEQKDKETGAYSKGRNAGLDVARSALHNREITPAADVVEVPTCAADDLSRAVIGLGIFRLSFCLNVEKTDSENDLVFRCAECPFEDKQTCKCSLKVFLNNYATKEDKQRFSPVV